MLVGLLGATGYTGRLTARELARRGFTTRLGGRSTPRLDAVPVEAERVLVALEEPASLAAFLAGLDVVISCAGPFAEIGDPVVDAAVRAGVPYVDSTGELDFMAGVYQRHADAGSPVVPACGFDYLPGDLAAALAAGALSGPADDVVVGYQLSGFRPSRGTARSAAGVVATATLAPELVELGFPDGDRPGLVLPWGEELTVSRHLPGARVRTALALGRPVGALAGHAGALLGAGAGLVAPLRPALAALARRGADRLPEGPDEQVRSRATFRVLATARGAGATAGVLVEGHDVYDLTAHLLVEAASRAGAAPAGALAPAQAFPPAELLDAVSGPLLSWRRV